MGSEVLYLWLPPLGWALWGLWGAGQKWVRRFLYPLVLGSLLRWHGLELWTALWLVVSTSVVAHLGYGESSTWLKRIGVALAYGASILWLGLSWWPLSLLLSGWWLTFFLLSRRFNSVQWRMVEGLTGLGHALACVWVVTH